MLEMNVSQNCASEVENNQRRELKGISFYSSTQRSVLRRNRLILRVLQGNEQARENRSRHKSHEEAVVECVDILRK